MCLFSVTPAEKCDDNNNDLEADNDCAPSPMNADVSVAEADGADEDEEEEGGEGDAREIPTREEEAAGEEGQEVRLQ